jgi:hypothetical protein
MPFWHTSTGKEELFDSNRDANRIEWLWRISRRIVTHNHQRRDFESLLADARTHFEMLTRTPDDLLRHIGSPFAPNNHPTRSQALAV